MSRAASPRLAAYAALAAVALVAALTLRRPELAALAAPFAVVLALGLHLEREPLVHVRFALGRDRALEHDEVDATIELYARVAIEQLELLLVLPRGIETATGANPVSIRLAADENRQHELTLRCARWGSYELGDVRLRARHLLGLFTWEQRVSSEQRLRVYPDPEHLRRLVPPLETQVFVGNEVARAKGEGLEFADTRSFVPGDRLRSINWRASARRNQLVVNEYHPERNTDVIVFLDSFAEARLADAGTLDDAVRAASALATRYLDRRDRVGLVSFGGVLRWLVPGSGLLQRYRIVDALLETEVELSYAWKDVNVIPARTLPPQALVLAVTPLLDPRAVDALLDLRARGYDLAVVEVSPERFVAATGDDGGRLAYRLWLLRREELRSRYQRLGVAVGRFGDDVSLEAALEGVRSYRRHAALARR
jgi:uncharacterized protein (DUF58 family)